MPNKYVYKGFILTRKWSNKDMCWYWSAVKSDRSMGCGNLQNEKAARDYVDSKVR